jgi:hypothetical protein
MFGMQDVEKVRKAPVLGPDGGGKVAGDPVPVPDLSAPRAWATTGEWGDLSAARSLVAAPRGWSEEHAAGHDLALESWLRARRNDR